MSASLWSPSGLINPTASAISYFASGIGAVTRTVEAKLREMSVSIADYGGVGDGTTDDTAAFYRAYDALPSTGGTIKLLTSHAISSRLTFSLKPVYLEGVSQGNEFLPVQVAGTKLNWIGGVSSGAMVRIGNYGIGTNVLWGGGISKVHFNGGGTCAHALEIGDASMGSYRDLYAWNTTASGLHLISDGLKTNMPSAWNSFYKCFFDMRAALSASANAHGVLVEAINGTNAGITLNYFEDLKVNHSGGDGIRWVKGGDGFVFMKPQFFRADSETGYACNFASLDLTDICNHAVFYYPIASGGMYFASPGLHQGTYIHGFDSQNINSGVTELVSGPGASEVAGVSSFGQQFGITRFGSTRDVLFEDNMAFLRWDSVNGFLHTNNGNWRALGAGGTISAAAEPGSGTTISTLAALNDISVLSDVAVATNGVASAQWPSLQFGIKLISTTAVKVRWGLFNSNADPAGDGIWIEFDPTLSGGAYRLVCSRGSVQTVIVNPAGLTGTGNPIFRWRIDVQPGRATFYAAGPSTPNPQLWTYLGTSTTNVPITSTALLSGVFIKTTDASAKTVTFADFKRVQRSDYL